MDMAMALPCLTWVAWAELPGGGKVSREIHVCSEPEPISYEFQLTCSAALCSIGAKRPEGPSLG